MQNEMEHLPIWHMRRWDIGARFEIAGIAIVVLAIGAIVGFALSFPTV